MIFLSRKLRLGGGSSFPGRLVLRICPSLIRRLAAAFPRGTVLVTATNGKTTTTRMIAAGLKESGLGVVYNISGANMAGGIATALVESARLSGRFRADIGLFEVDEGSFERVAPELAPKVVVVGNFFRDQLDRYGEVSILANRIRDSLLALPSAPLLLVNGDDPIVETVTREYPGAIRAFGLASPEVALSGRQTEADIRNCPLCHGFLEYEAVYLGHLGDFRCPDCGFSRRPLYYTASGIAVSGLEGQNFTFTTGGDKVDFSIAVPGRHGVYNALAALSLLHALDCDPARLRERFAVFQPPYGRFERFEVGGRRLYLILIKNPAGANVVLRMLKEAGLPPGCLCFLNDLSADGRDISWIYDAHFELLAGMEWAVAGGRRGADMALRLVYAGLSPDRVDCIEDFGEALDSALDRTPAGETLAVFATYTAMHRVRAALAERTGVSDFWEE